MDKINNQKTIITEDQQENIYDVVEEQNQKVEDLKLKLSQNQNKIHDIKLRTLAKIENIKKNALEQIKDIKKNEIEKFLKKIMPMIDYLEDILILSQTLSLEKKDQSLIEGIELTLQSLLNILYKIGVRVEGKKNELFNPQLHTLIATESSVDILPNYIISTKKHGFTFNQVLLRKAIVKIAKE